MGQDNDMARGSSKRAPTGTRLRTGCTASWIRLPSNRGTTRTIRNIAKMESRDPSTALVSYFLRAALPITSYLLPLPTLHQSRIRPVGMILNIAERTEIDYEGQSLRLRGIDLDSFERRVAGNQATLPCFAAIQQHAEIH